MNTKKNKNIFWIDESIKGLKDLEEFEKKMVGYEIKNFYSVKEAFDLIEKEYDSFKFNLLYIVIAEELSEEFFIEYNKRNSELIFLPATIIYTSKSNNSKLKNNIFYGDPFLNHGKDGNSILKLVDYIKSEQCPYYISEGVANENEIKVRNKIPREFKLGAQFSFLNCLEEMAYPILICKSINWSLIEKDILEDMQKDLIKKYPELKHIIKPSQEKDIFIPYNILAKYYLHLYTLESDFYKDLAQDLEQGKFDKYRIYIYLLYSCLNKGLLEGFNKAKLYKGGTLSQEEFNDLNEKIKKIDKNTKLSLFSKKFLSFSKKEEVANVILEDAIGKKYEGVYVKFIIEEEKENKNNYCTNIDLNKYKVSEYNNEEEVLFLPFSCFEVTEIKNGQYKENKIYIIKLKYLNEYEKKINEKYLDLLKNKEKYEEEIDTFIKKGFNSNFSKELLNCLSPKLNENLNKEYKQVFPLKQNIFLNLINEGNRFLTPHIIDMAFKGLAGLILLGVGILGSSIGANKKDKTIIAASGLSGITGASMIGGIIFSERKHEEKIKRIEDEKRFLNNSNFYCLSSCYGYVPQKYKKSVIPTLRWNNDPKGKCKSFAIELIIDWNYDDPAFLIINIDSNELNINEFYQKGDIIIKYKGIPENAFSAYFALYMFSKPKITEEEFFKTKNLLKDGLKGNASSDLISYKILKVV